MLNLLGEKTYDYLIQNNVKFVYPRSDNPIDLPLKPSKEVNEVLAYVTPTKDGIAATTGKHRGLKPIVLGEIVRRVNELFSINSLRKSNGGYKAQHKLIRDYLNVFYLYQKPWDIPSLSFFEELAAKWNPLKKVAKYY